MEKTSDFTILDGRKTYQHFYGIVDTPESFKECREEMIKVDKSWTGAMMQCVTGHLQFIAENGLETWRKELRKSRDEEWKFDRDEMTLINCTEESGRPPIITTSK